MGIKIVEFIIKYPHATFSIFVVILIVIALVGIKTKWFSIDSAIKQIMTYKGCRFSGYYYAHSGVCRPDDDEVSSYREMFMTAIHSARNDKKKYTIDFCDVKLTNTNCNDIFYALVYDAVYSNSVILEILLPDEMSNNMLLLEAVINIAEADAIRDKWKNEKKKIFLQNSLQLYYVKKPYIKENKYAIEAIKERDDEKKNILQEQIK